MSDPLGVMSVILLEAAVGGSVVLWTTGVWGKVRRGFFLLTGMTVAVCALGAWALGAEGVAAFDTPTAGAAATALAVFAGACVAWQALTLARQGRLAGLVGAAASLVGVGALVLFGLARPEAPLLAVAELALGSIFLGSALFGLLLGHWYLVERRLSNVYMIRSSWWYIAGVVAALGAAALSALNPAPETGAGFSPVLAVPGFSVMLAIGLVSVCALIAAFVWKLAREGGRSIQAATGMFYLAVIMAFSAELSTKFRFF